MTTNDDQTTSPGAFAVYSTCPQSSRVEADRFREAVIDSARWAEEAGCHGALIYTDNSLVSAWTVASVVVEHTSVLRPLVATQPVDQHPHTTATFLASMAHIHGRAADLNLIAGGFITDLHALGDTTPHDRRYDRLVEFTEIVQGLTAGETVTVSGEWYRVDALTLSPPIPTELAPSILMSGSSEAGLAAAARLGATAVQYPRPPHEVLDTPAGLNTGIRVGIIARDDAEEAWRIAHERFPPDRKGELLHQLAMARSDSVWHADLSRLAAASADEGATYWLHPFQNYNSFCPYLVGTHDQVAEVVAAYWEDGHRTMILDIPHSEADLIHSMDAITRAGGLVSSAAG